MTKYDNSGIMFRNNDRQKDSHPEFKGSITVEGQEYWLSAWVNEGPKGKFFGIKLNPKESQAPKIKAQIQEDFEDDDLPF
jgi:hypothetical protein